MTSLHIPLGLKAHRPPPGAYQPSKLVAWHFEAQLAAVFEVGPQGGGPLGFPFKAQKGNPQKETGPVQLDSCHIHIRTSRGWLPS